MSAGRGDGELPAREYGEARSHPVIIEGVRRRSLNPAVRALVSTCALRTALVKDLSQALGGSIASLGFPVGMGIAPPADLCDRAAAKFIDRVFIGILHAAKELADAEDAAKPTEHNEITKVSP